jgi:hypothetical protein
MLGKHFGVCGDSGNKRSESTTGELGTKKVSCELFRSTGLAKAN